MITHNSSAGHRLTITCGQAYSPPWPRRGGCASRKCCEATLAGADGVVGSTTDYRMLNQPPLLCPSEVASRLLLIWAHSPLLFQGGEYARPHIAVTRRANSNESRSSCWNNHPSRT